MKQHPNVHELSQYIDAELSTSMQRTVGEHLAICETCGCLCHHLSTVTSMMQRDALQGDVTESDQGRFRERVGSILEARKTTNLTKTVTISQRPHVASGYLSAFLSRPVHLRFSSHGMAVMCSLFLMVGAFQLWQHLFPVPVVTATHGSVQISRADGDPQWATLRPEMSVYQGESDSYAGWELC